MIINLTCEQLDEIMAGELKRTIKLLLDEDNFWSPEDEKDKVKWIKGMKRTLSYYTTKREYDEFIDSLENK